MATQEFKSNVDIMKAFNSKVMLINDVENCENGQVWIKAGADGPPIHLHPEQEEYFRILKGELDVYKNTEWKTLKEGEEIFIPKKTAHSYRSRSTEDCIFEYKLSPKRNFSNMMKTFERLMKEGKLISASGIKSIIYLSMTFKKYEKEVVSVNPPPFVISLMAGIGKLFGFKIN